VRTKKKSLSALYVYKYPCILHSPFPFPLSIFLLLPLASQKTRRQEPLHLVPSVLLCFQSPHPTPPLLFFSPSRRLDRCSHNCLFSPQKGNCHPYQQPFLSTLSKQCFLLFFFLTYLSSHPNLSSVHLLLFCFSSFAFALTLHFDFVPGLLFLLVLLREVLCQSFFSASAVLTVVA
jgi:hypothetical protein